MAGFFMMLLALALAILGNVLPDSVGTALCVVSLIISVPMIVGMAWRAGRDGT